MNNFKEIENLLNECEKDVKTLKKINAKLKEIEKRRKKLDKYYSHQYIEDYDNKENINKSYKFLDEDSIWNVLELQYSLKIKLIKALAKKL